MTNSNLHSVSVSGRQEILVRIVVTGQADLLKDEPPFSTTTEICYMEIQANLIKFLKSQKPIIFL